MLYAERAGYALALACSAPWLTRSVGFVGSSDGWQQLTSDGRLVECYARADNGNVAMTGEIDLAASRGHVRPRGGLWQHRIRSRPACASAACRRL